MATRRLVINLSWPSLGGPGVNVWHIREDSESTAQNLSDALEAFYTSVLGGGILPVGYTASFSGEAVSETDSDIMVLDPWSFTQVSGDANFAALVDQVTCTKRTTIASRSGRGRVFLGPLAKNAIAADGSMLDSTRVSLQGYCDTLVSASEGELGGAIGVYSRSQEVFRDLVSLQARDSIKVLRSRRD